jgi:alkylation response protein AidB-like acyl-CoA dehydrogenase
MDFELSKEQKLLMKSVREFMTRECSSEKVRELMATETAFDEKLWEGIADQGWTALTLPEDHEGLALGAIELAAVAEVMGGACLPGPFLSNHWAGSLLAASKNDAASARWLTDIAEGTLRATVAYLEETGDWDPANVALTATAAGDGFRLQGTKLFVSDAATAGLLFWVARLDGELAIFGLDPGAEGVTIVPMPAIDATRKLYKVVLAEAGVEVAADALVARGESAEKALNRATMEATIAVCAELVGGMEWVLKTTVEYVKTRQQFGKTVGSFQAVQHHCANMLLWLESSRSATYYAAWAVSVSDEQAEEVVSIAKAYCSDAAQQVGNCGVQVHGGIGFTWEHDLQLYYKRAKSSELLFGDATYHRERIARRVVDR